MLLTEENLQSAKYLTKANIASLAPSVFAETKPSSEVSKQLHTHSNGACN